MSGLAFTRDRLPGKWQFLQFVECQAHRLGIDRGLLASGSQQQRQIACAVDQPGVSSSGPNHRVQCLNAEQRFGIATGPRDAVQDVLHRLRQSERIEHLVAGNLLVERFEPRICQGLFKSGLTGNQDAGERFPLFILNGEGPQLLQQRGGDCLRLIHQDHTGSTIPNQPT
jgi:hypothetical protein